MRKSFVKYCRVNQINEREIQIFLTFPNQFLTPCALNLARQLADDVPPNLRFWKTDTMKLETD